MIRPGSLARNVLSNWIVLASNVAFAFVVTPIIVRALGAERYGVWSFLTGLVAYSELLYLGLGSALVKNVAQFRAADDRAGINRLASVVASIYSLLGLSCLVVLVAVSPFVPKMFAEPLSPGASRGATITCALLGVRLLMIFTGSVFSGVLAGYNRYDLVNGVHLFSIAVKFVATPLLLGRGLDPLETLAWLMTVSVVLDLAVLVFLTRHSVKSLSIRPTVPKRSELKWLYGFGLQSFFILFAVKLISYTDTTVIGFTLGAASVALYSLPLQLVEYARMFVTGFAGVFLPKVAFMAAQSDMDSLRDAYLRSARIACFLAGWLGGLLLMLGPLFLTLWVGPGFGGPVSYVLLFLVVAMFGQVLATSVPLAFYQSLNLLIVPAAVLMVEAALNLVLSIWLAPRFGLNGVALATMIPSVISLLVLPRYLCRRIGVPLSTLARRGTAPGALIFAVTIASQLVGRLAIPAESWAALVARAAITVPLSIAVVALTFPEDERRLLQQVLRLPLLRRADSGKV